MDSRKHLLNLSLHGSPYTICSLPFLLCSFEHLNNISALNELFMAQAVKLQLMAHDMQTPETVINVFNYVTTRPNYVWHL